MRRRGGRGVGADVVASAHSFTSRTLTGPGGAFCVVMEAGERSELLVSGTHQSLPLFGATRVEAVLGGASCGSAGCRDAGTVLARSSTCISGRVLDGQGPVPNARAREG